MPGGGPPGPLRTFFYFDEIGAETSIFAAKMSFALATRQVKCIPRFGFNLKYSKDEFYSRIDSYMYICQYNDEYDKDKENYR